MASHTETIQGDLGWIHDEVKQQATGTRKKRVEYIYVQILHFYLVVHYVSDIL